MPTRTSPAKSKAPTGFPQTRWVKCDLSEDQKNDLKQREISDTDTMGAVQGMLSEGFKVSISYDERSDCFGAYATAPKEAFGSGTVCLSARAPLLAQALSVLLYKHFEVLREDWRQAGSEESRKDKWG